jgi:hypothetical protein
VGRLKPVEYALGLAERAYCVVVEVVVARISSGQPEAEAVDSERMHWGTCTRHAQERS